MSLGSRLRDKDVDDLHCTDQASGLASAALLRFSSLAAAVLALIKSIRELGLLPAGPLEAVCLLEGVGPAGVWRCRSGSGSWIWAFG